MTDEKPQDMTVQTRQTLEKFGIIKPVRAPKVETMENEIRKRGGKLILTSDEDGQRANVRLTQGTHAATGNTIGGAVANAFADALRSEPVQAELFAAAAADPDDDDEDDDDDGAAGEDSPVLDAVMQPEPEPEPDPEPAPPTQISNRPKRGRVTIDRTKVATPADPFGDDAPSLPDVNGLAPIGDARYETAAAR